VRSGWCRSAACKTCSMATWRAPPDWGCSGQRRWPRAEQFLVDHLLESGLGEYPDESRGIAIGVPDRGVGVRDAARVPRRWLDSETLQALPPLFARQRGRRASNRLDHASRRGKRRKPRRIADNARRCLRKSPDSAPILNTGHRLRRRTQAILKVIRFKVFAGSCSANATKG
jgi:hypothetical protein